MLKVLVYRRCHVFCAVRLPVVCSGLIASMVLVMSASVRAADRPGALGEMTVPGGVRAALDAIGETGSADRAQFVIEFARRIYQRPLTSRTDPRMATVQALLDHLDQAARTSQSADTVPLPLPPEIWTDVVFEKRATPQTLAASILRSRNAAVLYCALIALDDDTRAWLTGQRDLIADLAGHDAPAFLLAASALRVSGGAVQVPGGEPAQSAWEAIVGKRLNEPAAFVRALLSRDDGRLAYFFGALAQLTPAQIYYALGLDAPDASTRAAEAHRLYNVFHRLGHGWNVADRAFWRATLDPALLAAQLRTDATGRPVVPGTRAFWTALLANSGTVETQEALTAGEAAGFAWLCEQVFNPDLDEAAQRLNYAAVLFASRQVEAVTANNAADALDAVRAALKYPALALTLERAGLHDLAALAGAARRAGKLTDTGDERHSARALAQFQAAMALLARGAMRGSLTPAALASLVSSLSSLDVDERGDYGGQVARWIGAHVQDWPAPEPSPAAVDSPDDPFANAAGPLERDLLHLVAGPIVRDAPIVEWEGTRYRVDLSRAEAVRISRIIGDEPRPYLSSARSLADIADAITGKAVTRDELSRQAQRLNQIGADVDLRTPSAWIDTDAPQRFRDVSAALDRTAHDGVRDAPRVARTLLLLADDLAARGLMELAYACAMGYPTGTPISADDAATRHVFGIGNATVRHAAAWQLPLAGADGAGWRVTGSVLGLDVRLASFWMMPLSWAPPTHRPTLNDADRRGYMETAVLLNPVSLTDAQRDAIASALRDGRERLASARSADDARALADRARLDSWQRSLVPWIASHDARQLDAALSAGQLLALGMTHAEIPDLEAWGVNAGPRLGCLCIRLSAPSANDVLAWRWGSGYFSTAFADMNLRLAELLAQMKMPARLLGPVLSAATLELINNVTSRDQDDARALIEFARTLTTERLELFLALLTTDGPLVPVTDTSGPQTGIGDLR